jgi:hypothetical protein
VNGCESMTCGRPSRREVEDENETLRTRIRRMEERHKAACRRKDEALALAIRTIETAKRGALWWSLADDAIRAIEAAVRP